MSASGRLTQIDRRSIRTRAALLAAFNTLMLRDGYEGLTVSGIAEAANVGRSTFYEHFAGKEALLRASIAGPFSVLADAVCGTATLETMTRLMAHFRQNRRLAGATLAYPARRALSLCLSALLVERLEGAAGSRKSLPISAVASLLAECQLALVESWIRNSGTCSAGDMAATLLACTQGTRLALLGETSDCKT